MAEHGYCTATCREGLTVDSRVDIFASLLLPAVNRYERAYIYGRCRLCTWFTTCSFYLGQKVCILVRQKVCI